MGRTGKARGSWGWSGCSPVVAVLGFPTLGVTTHPPTSSLETVQSVTSTQWRLEGLLSESRGSFPLGPLPNWRRRKIRRHRITSLDIVLKYTLRVY
jgi:hypothetical protein